MNICRGGVKKSYVIYRNNGGYTHSKGRIEVFATSDEPGGLLFGEMSLFGFFLLP